MTKKLRELLETVVTGNNDLWRETEVASRILLEGGYPGHEEDVECLEGIETGFELEKVLSQGKWYFQETDKWKYETQTLYNREGGIKMVKGNAQEGLRKWFEAMIKIDLCPDCNVYCEKRFIDGRCE